jgi:hypothetical protein
LSLSWSTKRQCARRPIKVSWTSQG